MRYTRNLNWKLKSEIGWVVSSSSFEFWIHFLYSYSYLLEQWFVTGWSSPLIPADFFYIIISQKETFFFTTSTFLSTLDFIIKLYYFVEWFSFVDLPFPVARERESRKSIPRELGWYTIHRVLFLRYK